MITNISCKYKEYRLKEGKWILTTDDVFPCTSLAINRMQESFSYYSALGGYMSFDSSFNRRFGVVISKIVSVSICNKVKKIFYFNYDAAVGGL